MFADDMLVKNAVAKIDDGDVILTYGYSSTVFAIFMQAQRVRSLCPVLSDCSADLPWALVHISPVQWLSPGTGIGLSEVSLHTADSCSVCSLVWTGALAAC